MFELGSFVVPASAGHDEEKNRLKAELLTSVPVGYKSDFPIEAFDFIVCDEASEQQ